MSDILANKLGAIAGRCSVEQDRHTIIEAATALRAHAPTPSHSDIAYVLGLFHRNACHPDAMPSEIALAVAQIRALFFTPRQSTAMTAEPAGWRWRCTYDNPTDWTVVSKRPGANEHRIIEPLYAAPPSPDTVREAAQAVIDRWETPAWKDRPATATYINALRAALSSAPVAPAAPVAGTPDQWQDIIEQCAKVADTAMTHQHAVHAASIVDRALSDTGRDAIQRDASNRVDEAASIAKSIRALSRNDR